MKTLTTHLLFPLLALGGLLSAATPAAIGVIQSNGEFRVDGVPLSGNGTLRDSSVIETSGGSSRIQLGAARITLDRRSSATIYRDRLVLRQGVAVLQNSGKLFVNASTLRISSQNDDGVVRVALNPSGRVVVTAQIAGAEVYSAAGLRVASLLPGTALEFDPQVATAEPSKLTGCLVTKGSSYVLTDTTTNVAVELQGANLATHAGRVVEVVGPLTPNTAAVREANEIVRVSTIKDIGPCPRGAVPAAPAGRGPAGSGAGTAAASGSHSLVLIGSIVGGVAVAGTFAGLAATGAFSGAASVSPSQ